MCAFIIGLGLCDCGGQEVLQPAICNLKTQKTWWYNSVKVQSPEKQEHQCLRAEDRYLSSGRKQINLFFTVRFYLSPKYIGWCQPALVRNIFFTQFTVSNANFFRDSFIDIPINNVLQISGHPLAQLSWHTKLTITSSPLTTWHLHMFNFNFISYFYWSTVDLNLY